MNKPLHKVLASVLVLALSACTTIPVDQREEIRNEVDQAAVETIARMVAEDPTVQDEIDQAAGYLVGRMSATKVPIVGGGYGLAVLQDQGKGTRTYLDISRFDLGAGIGAGRFSALIIFENRDAMSRFRDGTWQPAVGAQSAAGTHGGSVMTSTGDGYSVRVISETGAALTATARLIKTSINHDLTDTGVSEVSIPNIGFASVDEQGESAPRVWDHKLPFFAQQVIDKGYDLPLPYGIGLTYAHVDQEQVLDNLLVGINGADKEPFPFVSFDNASSVSDSVSIKADAWLFPFLNVFGMLGKVDGEAPLDVLIDGNGMLDQLEIDCASPGPPNPLCAILEDQTFLLPINAQFRGTTYGIGMTLAGGWNGWFVTLPMNITYADMDGKDTDGTVMTVTPRFGKVFNLGRKGNLALFVGGNYLESDLTVSGTETTPNGQLVIDYTIDQSNKDNWNALLGFNWDINKRLSWAAEYDGFTGSRDAFITQITWKY
jgi:lipid-binding SYLF domain-containing protein